MKAIKREPQRVVQETACAEEGDLDRDGEDSQKGQDESLQDKVLALNEKRKFLAEVVRTDKVKMPDKLRAIQMDNDMAVEAAEGRGYSALAQLFANLRQ